MAELAPDRRLIARRLMRIAQFSRSDHGGGAERSALSLHRHLNLEGVESHLYVQSRKTATGRVHEIPNEQFRNPVARAAALAIERLDRQGGTPRGVGRVLRLVESAAEPGRWIRARLGYEDIDHPAMRHFERWAHARFDVLHLHNLHGGYFDIRTVSQLATRYPVILNLRDSWWLTGHCAHGMECERWKQGCGNCPDLERYPAIARDRTAANHRLKQDTILQAARLKLVCPSKWMLEQCKAGHLAHLASDAVVIPNGFDHTVFSPGPKSAARSRFGIDPTAYVIGIAARDLMNNKWKDTGTAVLGTELAARELGEKLVLLQLGAAKDGEYDQNGLRIVSRRFVESDSALAEAYRATDVVVHASKVESFGNVPLEARACGAIAVVSDAGALPEQVISLPGVWAASRQSPTSSNPPNGVVVPTGDPHALAAALVHLRRDPNVSRELAANGRSFVDLSYRWEQQARRFAALYEEMT